ncbi:hypothetical protein MES4922_10261 [Mesorhizobium ventifaucium]|uniref:Uncharacterized protein n=1 Tax=Mesorhizobium ventifaucium TaxID=666020 RepID=A0ABM9DCU2_9HYPH|nr:hypothetical protein MES4922_10261 [Mesorhizobium ventifaucium]
MLRNFESAETGNGAGARESCSKYPVFSGVRKLTATMRLEIPVRYQRHRHSAIASAADGSRFLLPCSPFAPLAGLVGLEAAGVRDAVEAAGASLLYLPPFSPKFNRLRAPSPHSRRCCEQNRENYQGSVRRGRRGHRPLHLSRMCQLLQSRRI